jgi:hypothetical protein
MLILVLVFVRGWLLGFGIPGLSGELEINIKRDDGGGFHFIGEFVGNELREMKTHRLFCGSLNSFAIAIDFLY